MDVKTVHIDTSIQIERCKAERKSVVVENSLKSLAFKSTSSYAKLEFKRAWLQRLAYLHTLSFDVSSQAHLTGLIDERLGSHPKHKRRLDTCLQAIEAFFSQVHDKLTPQAQLVRVRSHLKNAVVRGYDWWEASVTHEWNGTKCARADERPRYCGDNRFDVHVTKCKRGRKECSIARFFMENQKHFLVLKDAITALGPGASAELLNARKVIEKAEKDPECLFEHANCTDLRDLLIAVDGVEMDSFAANNDNEWLLIAESLGKVLINPVGAAKRKKQPQFWDDPEAEK